MPKAAFACLPKTRVARRQQFAGRGSTDLALSERERAAKLWFGCPVLFEFGNVASLSFGLEGMYPPFAVGQATRNKADHLTRAVLRAIHTG